MKTKFLITEGFENGIILGPNEGIAVGFVNGLCEGQWLGCTVDGSNVGDEEGSKLGSCDGCDDGRLLGSADGPIDGLILGEEVGFFEGCIVR